MSAETQERAYLDYAATAPFDTRLHSVMVQTSWANANSLHAEGREARKQLEDARKRIAKALGARQPAEVIFTSGGTESDNMALKGLVPAEGRNGKMHVIVSAFEHHAVLDAANALKQRGFKIDLVQPGKDGVVSVDAFEERAKRIEEGGGEVSLLAVMAVNNELGTVQPVRELARAAHAHKALFFADCVQALGKIPINLEESGVDAAAFSAHKVGGLKGSGALYVHRGVRIGALLHGGGQESGLRSGTSNVLGAAVFAAAAENAVSEREEVYARIKAFRQRILEELPNIAAPHKIAPTLATQEASVPHILNLLVEGLEGETVVQRLDALGIAASSASACSTGSLDPSHVLRSIGVDKDRAYGSLRLSFGPATTQEDISRFLAALPQALR